MTIIFKNQLIENLFKKQIMVVINHLAEIYSVLFLGDCINDAIELTFHGRLLDDLSGIFTNFIGQNRLRSKFSQSEKGSLKFWRHFRHPLLVANTRNDSKYHKHVNLYAL